MLREGNSWADPKGAIRFKANKRQTTGLSIRMDFLLRQFRLKADRFLA